MASNLLAIRASFEGLLPWRLLPHRLLDVFNVDTEKPSPWAKLFNSLAIQSELDQLFEELKELVHPLVKAKDPADLSVVLGRQVRFYVMWKGKLFALLLNNLDTFDQTKFLAAYSGINEEASRFLESKSQHDLSLEDVSRLNFAIEGACHYSENLLRTVFEGGPDALDVEMVNATLEDFVKVDFLILTVALMFNKSLRRWKKPILSWMAQQAEVHVNAMETKLLSHHPELQERLSKSTGNGISLKESRKQLGLE